MENNGKTAKRPIDYALEISDSLALLTLSARSLATDAMEDGFKDVYRIRNKIIEDLCEAFDVYPLDLESAVIARAREMENAIWGPE